MSDREDDVCIDGLHEKKRKWGVGIKLYEKHRKGYRGFWHEVTEDKTVYKLGNTYQDKESFTLFTTSKARGYNSGYHICLKVDTVVHNWCCKDNVDRPAVVKVRFSKVVAQGYQEYFGNVIVAKQITLLEEIKT